MSQKFTPDFLKMIRISTLNSLGFFFLDFLIPYVASLEIKASGVEMGIIFSVRTAGFLFVAPVIGHFADKVSKVKLIMLGSIGRGISYLLFYLSIMQESINGMIVANFLLGLMAGIFWVPFDVLVSQKSNKEHRSEAMGKQSQAVGQGSLMGGIIGFGSLTIFSNAYPGNRYLMYSALLVFAAANVVAGFLFLSVDEHAKFDEEDKGESPSYLSFFKQMGKQMGMAVVLMLSVLFLSSVNGSLAKPFLLVYLTNNLTSDAGLASLIYIPSGVVAMLVAPKLGEMVDRLDKAKVIAIGAVFGGITTWLLINTSSLVIFSLLLVVDTLIVTTTELIVDNLLSRLSVGNRGKVFGILVLATDMGGLVGPIGGGIIWDAYGEKAPFIFSIIVEILLIPVVILAIRSITPFLEEKVTLEVSPVIDD